MTQRYVHTFGTLRRDCSSVLTVPADQPDLSVAGLGLPGDKLHGHTFMTDDIVPTCDIRYRRIRASIGRPRPGTRISTIYVGTPGYELISKALRFSDKIGSQ